MMGGALLLPESDDASESKEDWECERVKAKLGLNSAVGDDDDDDDDESFNSCVSFCDSCGVCRSDGICGVCAWLWLL